MGFGLYYSSVDCLDAASYTGVQFELAGSLGSCHLAFGSNFSGDSFTGDDPARGGCMGSDRPATPPAPT